jgi:hypothetical protein
MSGRCDARPELAARPIALDIRIPALPRRGGAALAERFFCPLGWTVAARPVPLDPELPSWGDSRYVDLRLQEELRLADALNHLHVLLPVLDDAKHYGLVANDENDQAAAKDAFDVLHYLAGKRLAAGRLTVIDATNVQPEAAQAAGGVGPRA